MTRRGLFTVVLALGLLFVACGGEEPAPEADAGAEPTEGAAVESETVVIAAHEYKFDIPQTLPAGSTTFSLVNEGEEPHFIDIVRLTEDAPPVEDLIKMPEKKVSQYFEGQPNHMDTVKPGETSKQSLDIELTAGRYGYVCFIETKDGTPHAFLGMAGEFEVE